MYYSDPKDSGPHLIPIALLLPVAVVVVVFLLFPIFFIFLYEVFKFIITGKIFKAMNELRVHVHVGDWNIFRTV